MDAADRELEALFFVAATRARDRLFLSRASAYGEAGKAPMPSTLLRLVAPALAAGLIREETWTRTDVVESRPAYPVEVGGARDEFRYSEVDTYQTCPRQFYYRHVLDLPEPEDGRAFLAYRAATKVTLDWLEEQHREGTLSGEWVVVQRRFEEFWLERGPTAHIHEAFYREEALAFVRRLWVDRLEREPAPEWQRSVTGVLNGVRYTVPVDATRVEGDTLRVAHRYFRDRKPKDDHLELRYSLIRHAIANAVPGQPVIVEAQYPHETAELKPPRKDVDPRRFEAFGRLTDGITADRFPAAPAAGKNEECPRCPFAFVCPC